MALNSGTIPGRLRGPYSVPGIELRSLVCKASTQPTVLSFRPCQEHGSCVKKERAEWSHLCATTHCPDSRAPPPGLCFPFQAFDSLVSKKLGFPGGWSSGPGQGPSLPQGKEMDRPPSSGFLRWPASSSSFPSSRLPAPGFCIFNSGQNVISRSSLLYPVAI